MPQSVNDGKIHIARNGGVLGIFDRDKIEDMLDTGYLLPTDHYFDEGKSEWLLLSAWAIQSPLAPAPLLPTPPSSSPSEFKRGTEKPENPDSKKASSKRGRGNGTSRAKKKSESALAGWIACLFALVAAAGIWAWAEYLNDRLKTSEEKVKDLRQNIETLNREKQLLTEITPRGRIRGIITYEPTANQVAIMSGATVGLYRRADVEKALGQALETSETTSGEGFDRAVERLKSAISSPLEIGLTDSNGRIDLPVPGPGEYALVASAAKSGGTGPERYFWLMGFAATDQPSTLIMLNESNAISTKRPQFSITDVRGMATGTPETPAAP